MDHLARLIRNCLIFALGWFSASAFAYTYAISSHTVSGSGPGVLSAAGSWSNAYNALSKVACYNSSNQPIAFWRIDLGAINYSARTIAITVVRAYSSGVPHSCGESSIPDNVPFTFTGTNSCINDDKLVDPAACNSPVQCPSGQTRDSASNTCLCDSGFNPGGQMVTGDVYTACYSGCTLLLTKGWYDSKLNKTWGYGWTQTGSKCSVSDNPVLGNSDADSQAASKCGVGLCPGTVNGQSVCVACSAPKETTTTKDSSQEVNTPSSGASSASTSTTSGTSSTKCDGDKCTTTTTTTTVNPDGSKSDKTTTKEEPKQDFCTDNPKSSICSQGTWGGSCGSFSCDGDAVQCAQAKGSWELACSLKVEQTDATVQAGNAAISRTDEAVIKSQLAGASVAFDLASRLDSTALFGTPGACPADATVSLSTGPVTLPFSRMCGQLNLIGVAMMGLAYLIAAFIVFRPSKGA